MNTNPIGGGQLADPATLLASAERKLIALADLRVDPSLSCRRRLDPQRIRLMGEAIRSGAGLDPLVVAVLSETVTLIDGHHRYRALLGADEDCADVLVLHGVASQEEARWLAFWLHWKAAKPLTRKERRDGFRAYVRAGNHLLTRFGRIKTYAAMAAELGISSTSLWRWMAKDFPSVAARMARLPGDGGRGVDAPCDGNRHARVAIEHHAAQIAVLARGGGSLIEDARATLVETLRRLGDTRPVEAILEAALDEYDF